MSVEDATPAEFEGSVVTEPSYFRIFFTALTPAGALGYKDQTVENGGFDSGFTALTDTSYQPEHLNASVTQNGYVSVLAVDAATGDLTYIRETPTEDADNRFAPPQNLGKPDGVSGVIDTVLINGLTGRANVFLSSSEADNTIWWKFQNPNTVVEKTVKVVPPGTETPIEVTVPVEVPPAQIWSDWQQLPGALVSLTATQNADGRIFLAGINADGVPYLNLQSNDRPFLPENWSGWQDISEGLTGFEQIVCGLDHDALVHIFARIGDKIYMKVQQQVSSSGFGGWVLFASFASPVHTMDVSISPQGGLYLVAQLSYGANCPVYAKYQTGTGSDDWSDPAVIGHVYQNCNLILQPNADTSLSLFSLDPDTGKAAYLRQQSLGHWSATWTELEAGYAAIATTQDITPNPS